MIMNKNTKIAKELVKIAKSLIAEQNIANQQGEYKNFTGQIDFGDTKGTVSNATFILKEVIGFPWKQVVWKDGTWEDGTWCNGTWRNGTWKKGTWRDGYWVEGTWKNGTWQDGLWGEGIWEGGIWEWGPDMTGHDHLKDDSPDKWYK